jgi:hypothetical protein
MDKLKAYLIDKLGLEPGNPKWSGWQKFLDEDGKFDWKKFCVQQLLWHPVEAGIPVVLVMANQPPTSWWGWLLVAAAILFIRIVHEFVQFSTMPGPEILDEAVCREDEEAWGELGIETDVRVNGRHVNALERAADIFVGGAFCWLYVWGGYMLARAF